MNIKQRKFAAMAVTVLLIFGIYLLFDRAFPKTERFTIAQETVNAIYITDGNAEADSAKTKLSDSDAGKLITWVNTAKETRFHSVSDTPKEEIYVCVQVDAPDGQSFYLYQQKGTCYLEVPYAGIYEIDKRAWELVTHAEKRKKYGTFRTA